MTITPTEMLAFVGGAASLVTAIWYTAMYIGKITVRLDRHEDRLNQHDLRLVDHDEEMKFLKGLRDHEERSKRREERS